MREFEVRGFGFGAGAGVLTDGWVKGCLCGTLERDQLCRGVEGILRGGPAFSGRAAIQISVSKPYWSADRPTYLPTDQSSDRPDSLPHVPLGHPVLGVLVVDEQPGLAGLGGETLGGEIFIWVGSVIDGWVASKPIRPAGPAGLILASERRVERDVQLKGV